MNIWTGLWVPHVDGYRFWLKDDADNLPFLVSELIDQVTKLWNIPLLKSLFDDIYVRVIK